MENRDYSKIIAWIVVLAIFIIPMLSSCLEESDVSLNPNDYARIVEMDYKAVVVDEPGSKGKIVVTERITFDVHAASRSNGFWELWRDLCEDYVDGVRVHYKINSVKQIMPDGRKVVWKESPRLYWDDYDYVRWNKQLGPEKWYHSEGPYSESRRQYECVFFYVDDLYREKITFEIEYEMYNAVLRYGDCSDLYISMYSGDTTKYLESFSAEILIPNKDMPSAGNYKFTTYGTNANSFPVEESATKNPGYHTFSFDLTKDELQFKNYNEYIEFDLVSYGSDKHIFSEYASRNDYYNDDVLDEIWAEQEDYEKTPAKFETIKSITLIGCVLVGALVIFFGYNKIRALRRKYPSYKSEHEIDIYRDVPSDLDPRFAAELVFCKDKKRKDGDAETYSAILLSLARKGYVELRETSYSDLIITINEDSVAEIPVANSTNVSRSTESVEPIVQADVNQPLKSFFTDGPIDKDKAYGMFKPHSLVPGAEPIANSESAVDPATLDAFVSFESLTMCEKYYLDLIKRHAKGREINMSTLQDRISADYYHTHSFVEDIKRSTVNIGVSSGYFQKANWQEPKKKLTTAAITSMVVGAIFATIVNLIAYQTRLDLAFGGFFILGAACIANGLYLKSQAHKHVLLTEYGEGEYQKWRGLYNFLKSDTLMNERTVVELPLWEKYLVYATAFGISEKVVAAIKIRCPEYHTEAESKSIVHNSYCRSGRIRYSGRSFHSSVRSGYHGASYGGGYGGGGFGYGGGGRGGGGGH